MKVYGQLERAQIEGLTADPTGANLVTGRMWYRTDTKRFKVYDGAAVQEFADLLSAQTLQNKILEQPQLNTPTIQGVSTYNQVGSTPANPSAGNHNVYFKTDGKLYTLDALGNEVEVGSGAGGGQKNYFDSTSANIDNTIGSWETDDGAGSASPGLTLSVTSVDGELLAGDGSLKVEKDAADRNGHFVKVLSETIDPSDRGKINFGYFEFRALAGYVSDDLIWEVYDVTNSKVLFSGQPEQLEIPGIKGRFQWTTYLEETTEQVEYRLKVNNANTNAFAIVVDQFQFGPSAILTTPIVTPWENFEPEHTWEAFTSVQDASYRRVGDTMEMIFQISLSSAPSGTFYMILPDGLTCDLDYAYTNYGQAFLRDSNASANRTMGIVQATTSNPERLFVYTISGSFVTPSIPFVWDSADNIWFSARFPITQWKNQVGNVLNNNEFGIQDIVAKYTGAGQTHGPTVGYERLNPTTKVFDDLNTITPGAGSWVFTAPKTGYYDTSATVVWNSTTSSSITYRMRLFANGIQEGYDETGKEAATVQKQSVEISTVIYLEKGQTAYYEIYQDSNSSFSTFYQNVSFKARPNFQTVGAIKNPDEYVSTLITATTSLGNSETDIIGSEIVLTPGKWKLGFSCSVFVNTSTTSDVITAVGVFVSDAANNEVPFSRGHIYTRTSGNFHDDAKWVFMQAPPIEITETTTFKLRGLQNNVTNFTTVQGSFGDNQIWAERVR